MGRLMEETGLTQDQSEYMATIRNCGENLLSVINDIMDYTKLETAGMPN
jgi:signal transduction histidine kinase